MPKRKKEPEVTPLPPAAVLPEVSSKKRRRRKGDEIEEPGVSSGEVAIEALSQSAVEGSLARSTPVPQEPNGKTVLKLKLNKPKPSESPAPAIMGQISGQPDQMGQSRGHAFRLEALKGVRANVDSSRTPASAVPVVGKMDITPLPVAPPAFVPPAAAATAKSLHLSFPKPTEHSGPTSFGDNNEAGKRSIPEQGQQTELNSLTAYGPLKNTWVRTKASFQTLGNGSVRLPFWVAVRVSSLPVGE